MELQAAISALQALKEPCDVTLFTDSEYLRQGITEWLSRWKANQWRTAAPMPLHRDNRWSCALGVLGAIRLNIFLRWTS